MRRWLMAVVLLTGIVGLSRADYVVIRVLLTPPPADPKDTEGKEKKAPTDPAKHHPHDYVQVVIEAKRHKMPVKELANNSLPFMEHKWGRTWEEHDSKEIFMQFIKPRILKKASDKSDPEIVLKPPSTVYGERHAALQQSKDPDAYLKLASWCLEVGLPDKCQEVMNELEKLVNAKELSNPPASVVEALEAYKTVRQILSSPIAKKTQADSWKLRLNYSAVAVKSHYALVHNSQDPVHDGVERILTTLENNMKTFYLVFALKGKALPAPREKLTAVLAADTTVLRKFIDTFNVVDRTTDGCHTLQENLVIFPPDRLDKASERFEQEMKNINQSYGSIDLLNGKFRPLKKSKPKDEQEEKTALEENNQRVKNDGKAQVFALVDAALREEMEIAVATHEGARQLFVETGLLPSNTAVPNWLRYATASYFETPKGPFPGKNEAVVKYAFWTGAGGPHWAWRPYLDEMMKDNHFPDPPTDVLVNTLVNDWSRRAHELRAKPKEEGAALSPEEEAEIETARGHSVSWALAYFLLNDRFGEFMNFLTELGNLPRDVELDEYTFLTTFCRSFGIDTTGLTRTQPKGNLNAYTDLAKSWADSIRRYPATTVKLKFEEPKPDPKDKKDLNMGQ